MKKIVLALALGILITAAIGTYAQNTQADIAHSLVRLHVVANSDSPEDQAVKLQVRDAVIAAMSDKISAAITPQEAQTIITDNLDYINGVANDTLRINGFEYSANATVGTYLFPTKQYANITLPPGDYDALRIVLGSGGGQNWWCVMFPPLCFTDQASGELSADSMDILKQSMSRGSYELISETSSGEMPVQFKFRLLELWDEMIHW